jgi:hypothetical protein
VALIERLWDHPELESEHRRRSLAEARRWDGDRLAEQYERFFRSLCREGRRMSVQCFVNLRLTDRPTGPSEENE